MASSSSSSAVDYSSFLSDLAKSRKENPIRGLLHLELEPGLLSLLAGKPNPTTFPITSISFKARNPLSADGLEEDEYTLSTAEVSTALQYNFVAGVVPLVEWVLKLQAFEHKRKLDPAWTVTIGSGGQDLIYKAFSALVNPGDPVLVEAPVYAGVIPIFESMGSPPIEIETDADGVDPASLRAALAAWPSDKPRPKVLYTVPYGNNPSGATTTTERRKEILALASEYNFIILEDDPYYYLYFGSAPRPPSYFSLDTEGRVLRFDSLSKVLAAGLRLAFVTGPLPIIRAMNLHTASANLQANSTTQVIAHAVLSKWGIKGLQAHTSGVSTFYRAKRDVFQKAMERHLTGLARWSVPQAGMFFWFELVLPPGGDSKELIETKAFKAGVLALPGQVFYPGGRKTSFVRASFSLLDEDQVNEALRRLAVVIREEWGGNPPTVQ
ncbi:PLP-dependent transferase [Exidia glandulosa HHB12029]|uniref:PLP-dependent transferase n=1 Tax=Exidia glandulosa HHB12029 TaxID=1314781 RepID=A0A165JDH0_EXIGL|nr:PLP-dependent transferase [Exidia glandulosa HHB12029]